MPTVTLPSGTIYYREKGTGPAMIMLMGTGADHTSWARQVPVLSQRFRVVTPDNRGSGRSVPPPPPDATCQLFAGEIARFADALAIPRFHLVGYSFGSAVAMTLALDEPDRVVALSIHAGWAGPNPTTSQALDASRERIRRDGVAVFLEAACRRNFSPTFQQADPAVWEAFLKNVVNSVTRPSAEGVLAQANAGATHDVRARLPGLAVPTLVTTGEHDPLAGPAVAAELAAAIPGAELHIFRGPRAYHAIPLEMAAEFNEVVARFHGAHDT